MKNQFVSSIGKQDAFTANGALSNSSSGNACLDYFAKCGSYRSRPQNEVDADMSRIFGEDSETAIRIVFYNRMITRKPDTGNFALDTVQRGQGNKDEFIKSLIWLEKNRPQLLYSNMWVIAAIGCWKDFWYYSPATNLCHFINPDKVYNLLWEYMHYQGHKGLIAKYLPKIRSASNVKNDRHKRLNEWARGFCKFMEWSDRDYRAFKSDPENTAHNFQRSMCAGKWDEIDFDRIAGKALFNFMKGNILAKHGLTDKYEKWIEKQPVAKFTGYVYELYRAARTKGTNAQRITLNKQFDGLIEKAMQDTENSMLDKGVLCALDTSGSMGMAVAGQVTAMDICVSLGIFFSKFLKGDFADHVIMFDDSSRFLKLQGDFCDRVQQVPMNAMGSTNFQSVIDAIVQKRKQFPNIPVTDFPKVLLVVSDMQFNPSGDWRNQASEMATKTNYQTAMDKLARVGLPKMMVVWWNVNGGYGKDVPSTMDDEGTVLISGFDPSIVTLILGGEKVDPVTGEKVQKTPLEAMQDALNQEIFAYLAAPQA